MYLGYFLETGPPSPMCVDDSPHLISTIQGLLRGLKKILLCCRMLLVTAFPILKWWLWQTTLCKVHLCCPMMLWKVPWGFAGEKNHPSTNTDIVMSTRNLSSYILWNPESTHLSFGSDANVFGQDYHLASQSVGKAILSKEMWIRCRNLSCEPRQKCAKILNSKFVTDHKPGDLASGRKRSCYLFCDSFQENVQDRGL